MHNRLYFLVICFLVTIVSNCSMRPQVVLSDKQEVVEQFCSIGGEPDKPFVAGWSVDERQDLSHLGSQGGVLLSYKGCNMKVLTHCQVVGKYTKVTSTPDKKVMEITDSGRLYAELPMGARSLEAKVEGGRSLKLSYVIASTQRFTQAVSRQSLKGRGCADATHYVEAMYLGAFRLEEAVSAQGEANTLGGGGKMKTQASSLDEIGKLERCYESKNNPWCQGIIKMKVSPLENAENQYAGNDAGVGSGTVGNTSLTSGGQTGKPQMSLDDKIKKLSRNRKTKRGNRSKQLSFEDKIRQMKQEKEIKTQHRKQVEKEWWKIKQSGLSASGKVELLKDFINRYRGNQLGNPREVDALQLKNKLLKEMEQAKQDQLLE